MTYRNLLLERLNTFEKTHKIETLTLRGINIWPLLRMKAAQRAENAIMSNSRLTPKVLGIIKDDASHIQDIANKFKNKNLSKAKIEKKPFDLNCIKNGSLGNIDALFVSRPERHFSYYDGFLTSGHEDFLMATLSPLLEVEKWERKNVNFISSVPRFQETNFFNSKSAYFDSQLPASSEDVRQFYRQNFDIFRKLEKALEIPEFTFTEGALRSDFRQLEIKCAEYIFVLKQIRPKVLYIGLYYAFETMALMLAAKVLVIPVVEIQHGFIGKYQWFQTHWNKIPNDGYSLLPDYFWVWDDVTKRQVEQSFSHDAHKMIVGGNPRKLFTQTIGKEQINIQQTEFLEGLNKAKKVILVGLQYSDLLPELFLEAISKAPKDWIWLLRPHPMSKPLEQTYQNVCLRMGLINVDVIFNNSIHADLILEHCDHVLSEYSTLILDAIDSNVPVSISNDLGVEMVEGINSSLAKRVYNAEEIILHIKSASPIKTENDSRLAFKGNAAVTHSDIIANWEARKDKLNIRQSNLIKLPFFQGILRINLSGYHEFREPNPQVLSNKHNKSLRNIIHKVINLFFGRYSDTLIKLLKRIFRFQIKLIS